MIHDPATLSDVQTKWTAMRKIERGLRGRSYLVPGAGQFQETDAPPEAYNLPFVLAFAALDEILEQAEREHVIVPARSNFERMEAVSLLGRWQNYAVIDMARDLRNNLVHDGELLCKDDCLSYIDAIEAELKAWGVL